MVKIWPNIFDISKFNSASITLLLVAPKSLPPWPGSITITLLDAASISKKIKDNKVIMPAKIKNIFFKISPLKYMYNIKKYLLNSNLHNNILYSIIIFRKNYEV